MIAEIVRNYKFKSSITNKGVKWTYNSPYASHFSSVFETMIKAAKRAIAVILGNADITDEELMTAFTGAEAVTDCYAYTIISYIIIKYGST